MDGIFLINKPIFYTSHDIVDIVRRKCAVKKVGHAGSLDPNAVGLLVILVGEFTRRFETFSSEDKGYEGIMTLGIKTDTQDLEGRILDWKSDFNVDVWRIRDAFARLTGPFEQKVPRYSAVKLNGRKCYELARKDIAFETPSRLVTIRSLELVGYEEPDIFFNTCVSKGTYIRALTDKIGDELGTGAVLSCLVRTHCGHFSIGESMNLPDFVRMTPSELKERLIVPALT